VVYVDGGWNVELFEDNPEALEFKVTLWLLWMLSDELFETWNEDWQSVQHVVL
jgi:hypothetical protein